MKQRITTLHACLASSFASIAWRWTVILFAFFGVLSPLLGQNNVVLYNEDFSSGSPASFSLNNGQVGSNTGDNQWIINSQYNGLGTYPNTTNQNNTVSGNITSANGNYLHVHDVGTAPTPANANYDPSSASDRFTSMSSGICTKGYLNVRFSFFWVGEGNFSDYAELYYQINGGAWIQIGPTQLNNQSNWKYELIQNAAFDDQNDLRFGFRWKNNVGAGPSPISFGVDDLFVLGDVNTVNPATISITSVPASVCRGTNLTFSYQLSTALCDGNYSIEFMNGPTVLYTYGLSINYPTTTGSASINIPAATALGPCYTVRLNRIGPPPAITGSVSACIQVVDCPNDITTMQPVVTFGAEAPNGVGVCVGSVMDVPFWSTGTYLPGNTYTAELSDQNGSFANPQTIGTLPTQMAWDPQVVPAPGNVSGTVPATPDGCGYFIRVVSSNPVSIGTTWGPFCIKNCDIETNNRQDTSVCISDTAGVTFTMPYSINNPPATPANYISPNTFQIEVLSSMSFAQVNLGGLGSVVSTTSGNINVTIPPLPALTAMGISPGLYYIRVVATNSSTPNNALGTLVRLTIGAPEVPPPVIVSTDDLICNGDIVNFFVVPFNPQSQYQWFLNGTPFPNPNEPTYPLGILFNGGAGLYQITVQETNFGCPGPMSQPDSVIMLPPPIANLSGPGSVCFGDTTTFQVAFINNTAYGWSLNPVNGGTITDNGADEIEVVWNQATSGTVTVNLDYASNICGSTSGSVSLDLWPSPTVDAGADVDIPCAGDSADISATPSGGTAPYLTQWGPVNNILGFLTSTPRVFPDSLETYTVTVFDANGCTATDEIQVDVLADIQIDAGNDRDLCWGERMVLGASPTGPSTAQYTWSPGGSLNNPNAPNPLASPADDETYLLTVYDPVTMCTKFDSVVVTVSDTIFGPFQVIDTCGDAQVTLDPGPGIDFRWSTGAQTPTLITSQDGIYTVTVTPDGGCDVINRFTLSNVPIEVFLELDEYCDDQEPILDGGEGVAWRWSSLEETRFLTVPGPGSYRVTVTPEQGCIFANIIQLTELPTQKDTVQLPLCEGTTALLDPGLGATFNWSTGDISSDLIVDHPQHYFVTVTPNDGCNRFIFYDVEGIPRRDTDSSFVVCEDEFVVLQPGKGDSYTWDNGSTERLFFAREAGTYTCEVGIDDPANGCPFTAVYHVESENCISAIFIPSAFSPFGDQLNDQFGPVVSGDQVQITAFDIYNRWGERIYASETGAPWNGTYNGNLVNIGVYVWTLEYMENQEVHRMNGTVTIVGSRK